MRYLNGRKKKWILHNTKVKNVHLKFEVNTDDVKVILELRHPNEIKRFEVYDRIEKHKNIIEYGFENGLIWDFAYVRETGHEVCRIYIELNNIGINSRSEWEVIYEFMSENMFMLERNILEIRELIID